MRTLTGLACIVFALSATLTEQLVQRKSLIFFLSDEKKINSKADYKIYRIPGGPVAASSSTWTGVTSSDWNTGSNWDVGTVPVSTTSVIIPSGTPNNPSISTADAVASSVTISSSATLSMSGVFNLSISSAGSFTNNGSFNPGSGSNTLIFLGAGTINGTSSSTFDNVTINGNLTISTTPTINGNFIINSGTLSAAPVYGSSSTLIYNTSSATYSVGKEWSASTTSGSAGAGNPQHVTIQNVNIVVMPNGDRRVPGNLTISAGGLTLSSTLNKDLYIGGNWTNNASFAHNKRKVTFNGSSGTQSVGGDNTFYDLTLNNSGATTDFGTSTITIDSIFRVTAGTMDGDASTFIFKGSSGWIAGSGTKRFYNLEINAGANISDLIASAGDIHISNSYANNGTFTQDSSHTTFFDKSNATETLSGTGTTTFGNVTIGGPGFSFPTTLNAGSHSFTVCGRTFKFSSNNSSFSGNTATVTFALLSAGLCTIKNSGGVSGTSAIFYNVTISSGSVATGVDFGNGISTIKNNLTLNALAYVTSNAPKYSSSSTLIYNTTSNPYNVGTEWTGNATTAGSGVPQNVTIQNTNDVTMPNGDRGMAGDLFISSGTFSLGAADLYIAGNWYKANGSTFKPNSHAVIFNGTNNQSIGGTDATIFYDLVNSNTTVDLVLSQDVSVNSHLTTNTNTNLSIGSNTLTLSGTITGNGTLSGSTSSNLSIGGSVTSLGTLIFRMGYQILNNFTLYRTGITGSCAAALGSDLSANNITLTEGILATGAHLFTWTNNGTINGPNIPWASNCSNYSGSYIATCNADGSALSLTTPFAGGVGFKILQVGSTEDSAYFPVGADFNSANRMMIKMNSTAVSDFTVVVGKGDIGNTPGPRINRIWYVHADNATGALKSTMRLFFTKRDWNTWPAEDETEAGYDFSKNYLVQKDYSNGNYFINKSSSADIQDFSNSITNPYNTEIYGQYSLNISSAFDGSKDGITQFNKFAVVNGSDIVLPLLISNLKAWKQGRIVQIAWRCQHEENVDHYEIERASDANHFELIGIVRAKNTGMFADYSFIDSQPATGDNYYRIKISDKSGDKNYSAVVAIKMETASSIFIYPNPVTGHSFKISIGNADIGNYTLQIFDLSGRIIFTREINYCDTPLTENLMLPSNVVTGVYELLLRNNNKIVIRALVLVGR